MIDTFSGKRKHKKVVLTIIFILILLIAIFVFKPKNIYDKFEKGTFYVIKPPYIFISNIIGGLDGFFKSVSLLPSLRQKNKILQLKNEKLRKEIIKLSIKSRYKINPMLVSARVIGGSITGWDRVEILDAGTKQGVRTGMGVINTRGVCGIIINSAQGVSKMNRIDDRKSAIGAMLVNKKIVGLAVGFDNNMLRLEYIPNIVKVKVGDTVVSSGGTSIFPKGIVIGNVVKVRTSVYKTYLDIYVKSKADLTHLDKLYIITSRELRNSRKLLKYEYSR